MTRHNPNCQGAHCTSETGPTRLLPLSKVSKDQVIILCASCFAHEIAWRREVNPRLSDDAKFDLPKFEDCQLYPPPQTTAEEKDLSRPLVRSLTWQNWIVQPLRLTWPIIVLVLLIVAWFSYRNAGPCLWHGGTALRLSGLYSGVQVQVVHCKDDTQFIDRGGGWGQR